MSKAEKKSQNRYTTLAEKYAFIDRYKQAEKDLELTLEDIGIIINAFLDLCIENNEQGKIKKKRHTDKEWCQEVLKRFKETKKGRLTMLVALFLFSIIGIAAIGMLAWYADKKRNEQK